MSSATIEFSHQELSLILFALEGEPAQSAATHEPLCEEACPITDHLEEMFGLSSLPPEKQLARHLNNHMREALIESGMLELMAGFKPDAEHPITNEDQVKIQQANERLKQWSCEIKLETTDKKTLSEAVSRLPRSAWLTMPRTLWRLKKKLKTS
ncbi:MAG TPA: hypothetical protein VLR90_07730 [Blastocatellia bacterium]|nr:hypothetical protein [Blastocatellia bacterium]